MTPTSGNRPSLLVDTSVAVALVVADHKFHGQTMDEIGRRRLGLAGHALFETFSVLTRLPAPARRSPTTVRELLAANFPGTWQLPAGDAHALLARMVEARISGGAVYDALVGAAAAHHGIPLATRDERALVTYRALDVDVVLL